MENVIMYDSDVAAVYRTDVCGWVANGKFFGEGADAERMARQAGSTHVLCIECGKLIENKGYTVRCDECVSRLREEREVVAYDKLEKKEWDGKTLLYSDAHNEWYHNVEEITDDLFEKNEGKKITDKDIEEMRLIIGEPDYYKPIEVERWASQLSDEEDVPKDFLEAIKSFNSEIENMYAVWKPSNFAAIVDVSDLGDGEYSIIE